MKLSVVVAAWSGDEGLRRALEALTSNVSGQTEILVVSGETPWTQELAGRFPSVRHLPLQGDATVPAMRAAGLAAATGEVVALTEDHCTVAPSWAEAILRSHAKGNAVVAGVIDIAPRASLLDLAVYLFDYGAFVPGARKPPGLSGANVSFTRAALEALRPAWTNGFVEFVVEAAIRDASMPIFHDGDARVVHQYHYSGASITRKFFLGGRYFAGSRRAAIGLLGRLARIAVQPAVPLLLAGRVARRISRRPIFLLRCLFAFPWLIWLASAWSAGEWVGYVRGAGNSSNHWK